MSTILKVVLFRDVEFNPSHYFIMSFANSFVDGGAKYRGYLLFFFFFGNIGPLPFQKKYPLSEIKQNTNEGTVFSLLGAPHSN